MEKAPKTSFIPQQNTEVVSIASHSKKTFNVLGFFAFILFLGSVVLSVGLFLYKDYNQEILTSRETELADSRESFRQADMESIREINNRMETAQALLDQHISPSLILDALEARTQSNLQFSNFIFTREESGNASIKLDGRALRLNTIALQNLQFLEDKSLGNILFSQIDINEDNIVTFSVSSELEEEEVLYNSLPQFIDVPEEEVFDSFEEDFSGIENPLEDDLILDESIGGNQEEIF